jgi:hypothetical protein
MSFIHTTLPVIFRSSLRSPPLVCITHMCMCMCTGCHHPKQWWHIWNCYQASIHHGEIKIRLIERIEKRHSFPRWTYCCYYYCCCLKHSREATARGGEADFSSIVRERVTLGYDLSSHNDGCGGTLVDNDSDLRCIAPVCMCCDPLISLSVKLI